jgi:hypothetical protein
LSEIKDIPIVIGGLFQLEDREMGLSQFNEQVGKPTG